MNRLGDVTRGPDAPTAVATAEPAIIPAWAAVALAGLAMAVLWLVSFDNGQITGVLDSTGSFMHELFHDGRHLFGAPCH